MTRAIPETRLSIIPSRLSRRWRLRLSRAVQEFIAQTRAGKAPGTANAYESDLERLVALAGHGTVLNLTAELIQRYFRDQSEAGLKPATLQRKAAAVREFIRWGRRQRLWTEDLEFEIPRIRRPEALPRPFDQDEMARLWALELTSTERVLRALLCFTGLRVGVICGIRIADVSEQPPTIRTMGKGAKPFLAHMHPRLAEVVLNYVLSRTDLRPHSALLTRPSGRPYNREYVEHVTHRWGAQANVPDCIPHRFRHTFATELLRSGADIRVIQKALNHADLKSTAIYTKVHDAQVRDALLRLPTTWGHGGSCGEESR